MFTSFGSQFLESSALVFKAEAGRAFRPDTAGFQAMSMFGPVKLPQWQKGKEEDPHVTTRDASHEYGKARTQKEKSFGPRETDYDACNHIEWARPPKKKS